VASLLGILPAAGIVHGIVDSRASVAHIWYALVCLPIFQFVFWRSLFHWGLWVRVLGGFSRVPLRLLPMHADRRGGIGFLKQPSISYGAVLLLAMGSTLCAGWGTKILLYGSGIDDFKPLFLPSCSLPPSSPLRHS
jgi:Beta-tubulin folding cofactor D